MTELPLTQIHKIAADFMAAPRVESAYPLPTEEEIHPWTDSEHKKSRYIERLDTNAEVLESMWRIHGEIENWDAWKDGQISLRDRGNATRDSWAIRRAYEAVGALSKSRTSLQDIYAPDLEIFAGVLRNKEELQRIKGVWEHVDPRTMVEAFISHKHIVGREHVLCEAAMGNDVRAQFVGALDALCNAIDKIEALGLTPDYLDELAASKRSKDRDL